MRNSRQRSAILQVLKESTDHPTADVIHERVKAEMPNISLGTVYRDLRQLTDEGLITIVESSDKKVHYEGNLDSHIHFLCKCCGRIIDVFCSSPVPAALEKLGLTVLSSKTVYYGICNECANNSENKLNF